MDRLRVRWAAGICAGVVGVFLTSSYGLAAEADGDLKVLREELSKQRAYIEQLEKRVQAQEAKGEATAKAQAEIVAKLPEAGYDGGFYLRSKDKPFSIVVNSLGQFRYTFFKPTGDNANQTFDVALGRLAFSGMMFDPKLSYFMQIQGSTLGDNNNITMLDWWLNYQFSPEIGVQAGRFVLPYSRQFYTPPAYLMFADLSQADYSFNLPRSIGGHVSGKLGPVSYDAAVLNSIRALDASGQENFGTNVAALGRLELDILAPYGYYETSPKPVKDPQLSVGLALAYNPVDATSSFQNLVTKDSTTNVTLDMGYRWDRLSFQAAGYYRNVNYTTAGLGSGNDFGGYSQAGFYLIPEKLELAGQISGVKFDKLNVPGVFQKTTAYTVGMNYYFYNHNLKLQMDYSYLNNGAFKGQPGAPDDNRIRIQTQFAF
jgi:hypothetical protein